MANLQTQFTLGQTVYAIVLNSLGLAWNAGSSSFETPTAANWVNYAVSMAEQSATHLTGIYAGSFPTTITTAGVYSILFRQQSGGSPAATDASNGMLGGQFFWTGSAETFAQTTGGNVNVTNWNGTAVSVVNGLPAVQANTNTGSGPIAINQSTGGTDNLRYVDSSGNGVEGANILVYLAGDWPGNPSQVQAASSTGPDGRWIAPAFVQHGTYVAVFSKPGADGPDLSAAFTV